MKKFRELTVDELSALRAFADVHGRGWKADLAEVYWFHARIWRDTHGNDSPGYELHRLRNDLGPSWLFNFKFPKKEESKVAPWIHAH